MTFFSAIVLLGILIFVHELGHFIFAKALGFKVLKFSLGFGPKLLGRKYGDTEYLISAMPLGGYVKMLGEDPDTELKKEEKPFAFNNQPVWKRFTVVFLGPIFNLFFAAFVFFLIFLSGIPVPKSYIGKIVEDSPAAKAGLVTGDKIIEISGNKIQSWYEIEESVNESNGKTLSFKIEREGRVIELSVTPLKKSEKNIFGENIEIWDIGVSNLLYPEIGDVIKGSQAEKAGLKRGDRIIEIDGAAIKTWQDMTAIIHDSPEKHLRFKFKRDGNIIEQTITPKKETITTPTGKKKEIGLIGIKPLESDFKKRFGFIDALSLGIKKTWETVVLTVVVVVKLIQRILPADTLGGPIMIFQMAGEQASLGALNFFTFMAVLSINLGVLNLLPIPVLDGGHLMFLTIEAIRRKPFSQKVMIIAQRIGLALIITLMIFVIYNDTMRIVVPWLKKVLAF